MTTADSLQLTNMGTPPAFLTGWPLVGTASVIITLIAFATAYSHQFDVDGVRMLIRATARSSLLLFGFAFTASALYRLRPNAM